MQTQSVRSINRKGQFKIQEMAFAIVAIVVFFVLAGLFFITFYNSGLKGEVSKLREDAARQNILKFASSPELSWFRDNCENCIDWDRAFVIKKNNEYKNYLNLDFLQIQKIYPISNKDECTSFNYPNCGTITLINTSIGTPVSTFATACYYDESIGGERCELARIAASGRSVNG